MGVGARDALEAKLINQAGFDKLYGKLLRVFEPTTEMMQGQGWQAERAWQAARGGMQGIVKLMRSAVRS